MNYSEIFTHSFLKALSDWQRGWYENQTTRRQLADNLVEACKTLPQEFLKCENFCFRKRFIVGGEIVPIILDDEYFEGIASWTFDIDFAKNFKGLVNSATTFAMIFKQKPRPEDIIVNISELWKNESYRQAIEKLKVEEPELAEPLIKFKDFQSEIILRSNLHGTEIEHIVGVSSDFDEICDKAKIPIEMREELSKKYAKDPDGIPISMPVYSSVTSTKVAVQNTITNMRRTINDARRDGIPVYNLTHKSHSDDLKHKID